MGVTRVRRPALAALALCLAAAVLTACGSGDDDDSTGNGPVDRDLVWSDEFDGANGALPDPEKWAIEQYADATDTEKQCYTDNTDNLHTDGGGYLVVSALEVAGNCADGWYRFVTSGRITTAGIESWKYGRFEVRAKMPSGVGTWPAFWAIGEDPDPDVVWPELGEIDAMEYVGRDPDHLIGTIHGPDPEGDRWFLQSQTDSETPLYDDMHTYAVDWNADRVVWYLDDVEYGRITRAEAEERGTWVFDRPFHLILNLAIGGVLGGDVPDDLSYPQELVVDYVRVYQ